MFTEVRNSYRFGPAYEPTADGLYDKDLLAGITIDGWRTNDDNEPGTVIASVLLTVHGDIVVDWHDNAGRRVRSVERCIAQAKDELRRVWAEHQPAAGKVLLLQDGQGDLDLVRVRNWDREFPDKLTEAYGEWQASQSDCHEELYQLLRAAGYELEVADYEPVILG